MKTLKISAVVDKEAEQKNLIKKIGASSLSPKEKCRLITRLYHKTFDKIDSIKLEAASKL